VTVHPEVLVQLREADVADAEGLTPPKATQTLRFGEQGEVRRSPQAMACRKRDVEELGRPQQFL
jgi:hypothetical protein